MCALEKEVTSHSSILAWIEEPGGLQLLGSHSETPPKCLRTDGVGLSTEDSALMQPYSGSLHSHLFFLMRHTCLYLCVGCPRSSRAGVGRGGGGRHRKYSLNLFTEVSFSTSMSSILQEHRQLLKEIVLGQGLG